MLSPKTMAEVDRVAAKYQPPIRNITADDYTLPGEAEDAFVDTHRNAPKPDPACLYGLVGEVARAGSEDTEANPYAIAANFIAYMSAAVGRGPYMAVGNTRHHCRVFGLHVGRTGRGRKGDAVSLVHRIDMALQVLNAQAGPQVHRGGLSSREGLVFLIHDSYVEGKNEVPAIPDKRLWVVESEFVNVLQQGKRDGNTLSPALRDCWDGVSLKPATKTNRLYATDPHVNMSAAITPTDLHSVMVSRDLTNGFANRFLIFWAERTQITPFPKPTSQDDVKALAIKVLEVLTHCNAMTHVDKDKTEIKLSDAAKKVYVKLYRGELNDNSAGERITALLERRAPMLLRLAMLFALCDQKNEVDVHHINAALAWVRYSVESVKFIFQSALDEVNVAEVNDTAQKILEYLVKGEASRSDLTTKCFQGHTSKTRLDAALDELLSSNPPRITVESPPRPDGSIGRTSKIYRLTTAKLAKFANNEDSCGFAADSDTCEVSEHCEISSTEKPNFALVRKLRKGQNGAVTRMDADTSQTSQTSHGNSENVAPARGDAPTEDEVF
jgi:hypothetical protein